MLIININIYGIIKVINLHIMSKVLGTYNLGLIVKGSFPITQFFDTKEVDYNGDGVPDRHGGLDLACPVGTPIYAPLLAEVVQIGTNFENTYAEGRVTFGGFVKLKITKSAGTVEYLILGHLSSVAVAVGTKVAKGDVLGATGNSGFSTGAHLHIEWRNAKQEKLDPLPRLRQIAKTLKLQGDAVEKKITLTKETANKSYC